MLVTGPATAVVTNHGMRRWGVLYTFAASASTAKNPSSADTTNVVCVHLRDFASVWIFFTRLDGNRKLTRFLLLVFFTRESVCHRLDTSSRKLYAS